MWDLPTRVFHWTLVVAVSAALVTGFFLLPQALDPHLTAGGIVALLVLFRVLWAFLGSGPSRLSAALFSPRRILDRLRGRDHARYLGHNPLAGLVLALVVVALGALVVTGLIVLGGEEQRGPLRAWLPWSVGSSGKEVHEFLAWALVAGIVLHLAGLLHEGRTRREPLARSMITGRRRANPSGILPAPARARTPLALLLLAALSLSVGLGARELAQLPPSGWRSLESEPAYAAFEAECGTCHTLYHPSLLPAASWTLMMATLDEHFGEDASLSQSKAEPITSLLADNANATWDTEAANRLRTPPVPPPLAVTELPWWKHRHAAVLEEAERTPSLGSPGNCEACHPDAVAGRFAGELIHPPVPETPR